MSFCIEKQFMTVTFSIFSHGSVKYYYMKKRIK